MKPPIVNRMLTHIAQRLQTALRPGLEARVAHLRKYVVYPPQHHGPASTPLDDRRLDIVWVIPDFLAGAGGHATIFRMARHLEGSGHRIRFLIQNPVHHASAEAAKRTIERAYRFRSVEVHTMYAALPVLQGDALIATDRFTCYPVRAMGGFRRKFYFVQDYETMFSPAGSDALLTEATYGFEFDCLCAGDWLAQLMRTRFGRWSVSWPLAFDPAVYFEDAQTPRSSNRIAFYARHGTPRRAVELGVLALDALRSRGIDVEIDLFGGDIGSPAPGSATRTLGVCDDRTLANLYRQATLGIVFSATNHSLVNKEMMACGLPVIDLDLEQVRTIFPPETIALAPPTPEGIADLIASLLSSPERRQRQAAAAAAYVKGVSWAESARIVERALLERLRA